MNRRTLVARVGAGIAVLAFAGCVADGNGGDDDSRGGDNEDTPDESETETDPDDDGTESPPESDVGLAEASLTVVDVECGQQHDEADVAFETDTGDVIVTGTIWGSDLCKIPELVGADYDAQADELAVTVGTTDRESDSDEEMACGQCIAELDYRVTAAFDGGLPGSVTVVHDHGDGGEPVTTSSKS